MSIYDQGEPVEFENQPVEVGDCRLITDHFRGIFRMNPNLMNQYECGSGGWEWRSSA